MRSSAPLNKFLMRNIYYLLTFSISLTLLSACQSLSPQPPLMAQQFGKASVLHTRVQQRPLAHLLIQKPVQKSMQKAGATQRLHVYIEGDGVPYPSRFQIATDPSPRYPLMLQLMQYDRDNSIYLGRPCYFTGAIFAASTPSELNGAGCSFHDWTDARYSETIIASMTSALRNFLARHPAKGVTLIGHSGGGTIATLMAARMPEVDQLVTLAANLDTRAWTRYHHYSPLTSSLNPAANISHLNAHQLHLAGARDDNVPPALIAPFVESLGQQLLILPDADHTCCWQAHWPGLLQKIEQQMQQ